MLKKRMIKRYIKHLPASIIALVAIIIVAWAIVQEPLDPLDSDLTQENSIPFYIPPPSNG
ncbi:MAG: hypothetical protein JSV74_00215 [Dehalococcoidia bacterium]|nr:MAG: hypothetical protein JSV74_00215 [Dehalococcoidia bacterium]